MGNRGHPGGSESRAVAAARPKGKIHLTEAAWFNSGTRQQNLGEVFFAREAKSLMEAWMKEGDAILEDEQLLDLVYEQLGRGILRAVSGGGIRRRPKGYCA